MSECKHPKAFVMNDGHGLVCNLCGARLDEAPKKEPVKEPKAEEPKKAEKPKKVEKAEVKKAGRPKRSK